MNVALPIAFVALVLGLVLWIVISRLRVENRQRHLSEYITNNMPSGMLTVDTRGFITAHNPSSQQIFGYDLGTGRRLADLVEETQELSSLLDQCVRTGEAFTRREFNVSDPAGPRRHIGVNFSAITTPTGQVDGVICLLSDLTEIVKLQDQIRLKDNFASLGEMSAGIAHEFKNSLATISGYSQMLGAESDPAKMQKYACEIDKETRNLSKIVSEFLNFARPVETSMHPTQIGDLVSAAVQDLKSARSGKYTVKLNSGYVPPILCDTTLLQQAIFNLLINAADASSDDGVIEVSVELDDALNQVQLHVIDSGRGISPQDLQKIFIPFFTTKVAGTGLGLPLVQKIVLAHSGTIMIDSSAGAGTRVSISLPVHAHD